MPATLLHLASASPRRSDILRQMGIAHTSAGVNIDETPRPGEKPCWFVSRMAREKAAAVDVTRYPAIPILAADTVVVLDERIYGKPQSEEDALQMLQSLSGRAHNVLTSVALRMGETISELTSSTEVEFRDIKPDEARAYWHSREPIGKAGAYAIQGIAGVFVRRIHGSYSGVVGLPIFETAQLLQSADINVLAEKS